MRTSRRVLLLLVVAACVSACTGCAGDVAANNDAEKTKEKLQPPTLQPSSAPGIRASNPAPAPLALKPSPSSPPAAAKPESTRTETRERPRGDDRTALIQGSGSGPGVPIRIEAGKDDRGNRGNEGRDRDRNRDDSRGNGGERRGPRGDGERRDGDGARTLRPDGGRGPEIVVGAGGLAGLGGDNARKFKSPPLPEGIPSWFKDNDKDGDGQVALFEWPNDDFNKYDRNGDGFITIAEAMRFAPKPVTPPAGGTASAATPPSTTSPAAPAAPGATDERSRQIAQDILNRYDRNRDGKLDQQEIQNTTRLRMSWQQYDANRDNIIDLDEMVAFAKGLSSGGSGGGMFMIPGGPGGPGGDRRDGDRGRGGPGNGRGPGGGNDEERTRRFIASFDRNNDSKLSREEFPRFMSADRFDQMDSNRDGQIDVPEWIKGSENMFRGRR